MMIHLGKQHLIDCAVMSATALRRRYAAEANSHRNMKQRAASLRRIIHREFESFNDFLIHVGPQPRPGDTLDRIDNSDPEYAPGKVRWADKSTQNSNKGDSLTFHCSRTGHYFTSSQIAGRQSVSVSTIRQRVKRNWTADEIIAGERATLYNEPNRRAAVSDSRSRSEHVRPAPEKTDREIEWEKNARIATWHREEHGEQYFPADIELLIETAAEFGIVINRVVYEEKVAKLWRVWKPHLDWYTLPEWAQELTAKLDGTTPAEIRRKRDGLEASL